MQRPRRTSEFHEEPGTATKRQARTANRFTASVGLTPAKMTSRLSARQTASVTGSATRGRFQPTPQKTPLNSNGPQRSLFSAEKKRNAAGVLWQNDKKWVQDQTQRVTEYLRNAYSPGTMANISDDFFSRPNCLKQMSIKQFVGIINYFLQFVGFANRFKVGTNYLEDIVNVMQKLNYPYQLNKSWLKTPTHSFGNVILLFDFFMEFVLDYDDFELDDLKPDDPSPDLEYKGFLWQKCSQSFRFYDEELQDELRKVELEAVDVLIQKRYNLTGVDAIEFEIASLEERCNHLLNAKSSFDSVDENHCEQLRKRVKAARAELDKLEELNEKLQKKKNELLQRKSKLCAEASNLEKKTAELRMAIKHQKFSVQSRDEYAEKIKYLRSELESKQSSLQDLQNRYHNKKVEFSSAQKSVIQGIESVNSRLRDLCDIIDTDDEEKQRLLINMDTDTERIKRCGPRLKQLRFKLTSKLQRAKEQLQNYEKEMKENIFLKFSKFQPELQAKSDALEKAKKTLETFEKHAMEESSLLNSKNQEVDIELNAEKSENDELENRLEKARKELQQLEHENVDTMSKFEEEHRVLATARKERLAALKSNLSECLNELEKFNKLPVENGSNKC